jgi:diguanylate cyclase (GGDEF)-like protein
MSAPNATAGAWVDEADWLRFVESCLVTMLEASEDGFFVFDAEGVCRMIGRKAGDLFDFEPASFVGKSRREVLDAVAKNADDGEGFLAAASKNDLFLEAGVQAEVDVVRPQPRRILWLTYPIVQEGRVRGRLAVARDVTRERSAERSIRQLQARVVELSPYDVLTGLPNARRFHEELEREHLRSERHWECYAILRVAIDDAASLEAELGRPTFERLLDEAAVALRGVRRDYDLLARIGESDFALLLPGAGVDAVHVVKERVTAAVAIRCEEPGVPHPFTVSIGSGVWLPPAKEAAATVLAAASLALEEALARGPSAFVARTITERSLDQLEGGER